jgi:Cu+-exporting ATPase
MELDDGRMVFNPGLHLHEEASDPVCEMVVKRTEAAGASLYKGQPYFFCSAECKARFDADPERYAARQL